MTAEIRTLSRMSEMEIAMKDAEKAFSSLLAAAQRFRSYTGNGKKYSGRKMDEFFQFLSQHEEVAKRILKEAGFISGEPIYRFDSEKDQGAVGASSAGVILGESSTGFTTYSGCQYANGEMIESGFIWKCLPYPRGVLYLTDEGLYVQSDGLDTVIMSKENGNPLFDVSADIKVDHFGGIFYEVFIPGSGKGSGMVMKRYYHPAQAEWISLSVPTVWEEHRNEPTLEWAGLHPSGKIISHWILTVGSNKWDTIFLGDEKLFDLSDAESYDYGVSGLGVVVQADGKVYIDNREICTAGKEAELYACRDGFILHEDGQFVFRTATDEQLLYTGEVDEAFVEIAGNDLFVVVPRDGENGIRPEVRRIPVEL